MFALDIKSFSLIAILSFIHKIYLNIYYIQYYLRLADVLNKTVIFKKYIDDIIWLSYDYSTTTKIKELLHAQFDDFNLQIVFNSIKFLK